MIVNEIERDVKIPVVHSKHKYPWDQMEINDSVFIKAEKGESLYHLKRTVGPAARYYADVTGKKFKTLLMREDSGIRVWRTE